MASVASVASGCAEQATGAARSIERGAREAALQPALTRVALPSAPVRTNNLLERGFRELRRRRRVMDGFGSARGMRNFHQVDAQGGRPLQRPRLPRGAHPMSAAMQAHAEADDRFHELAERCGHSAP